MVLERNVIRIEGHALYHLRLVHRAIKVVIYSIRSE